MALRSTSERPPTAPHASRGRRPAPPPPLSPPPPSPPPRSRRRRPRRRRRRRDRRQLRRAPAAGPPPPRRHQWPRRAAASAKAAASARHHSRRHRAPARDDPRHHLRRHRACRLRGRSPPHPSPPPPPRASVPSPPGGGETEAPSPSLHAQSTTPNKAPLAPAVEQRARQRHPQSPRTRALQPRARIRVSRASAAGGSARSDVVARHDDDLGEALPSQTTTSATVSRCGRSTECCRRRRGRSIEKRRDDGRYGAACVAKRVRASRSRSASRARRHTPSATVERAPQQQHLETCIPQRGLSRERVRGGASGRLSPRI